MTPKDATLLVYMVNEGHVRLYGTFRAAPFDLPALAA